MREVASQKTAALRMSLDAVERQGMPFRGETGGVGAGQGMGEVPASDVAGSGEGERGRDHAAVDPARSRHAAPPRRRPAGSRRARRPRRHPARASQHAARAVTPARVPAVGGTRDVPAPDDVARDYLLLGLRLDQHLPGTVDGYFGPAELKARVDMEPLRPPARLAEDALALRVEARRRGPGARSPPLARPPAGRGRDAGPGQGRRVDPVPRPGRALPVPCAPSGATTRPSSEPRAALDELLPGHGSLAERLKAEDDAWTVPVRSGPGRRRGARRAVPGSRGVAVRAARGRVAARLAGPRPAVVRLQLVRRRLPLAGRHQPRPPDPPPEPRRRPWPTRPTPATTSSTRRRSGGWSRSSAASSPRSC